MAYYPPTPHDLGPAASTLATSSETIGRETIEVPRRNFAFCDFGTATTGRKGEHYRDEVSPAVFEVYVSAVTFFVFVKLPVALIGTVLCLAD